MNVSLRLETISTATNQDKFDLLFKLLQNHPGSTLIYVTLQKVSGHRMRFIRRTDTTSSKRNNWQQT